MPQHFRRCLSGTTILTVPMLTLPNLRPRLQVALLAFLQVPNLKDVQKIISITKHLVTGSSRLLSGESLLME
jgi:hypothetical protein